MKFHSLSFSIDEKTVYDFETSNGLLLPKQYRDFLLKYNVTKPEPNGFCIAHVNEINNSTESDNVLAYFLGFACEERESRRLQWAVDIYRGRIPDEYLPIGFDYFGNVVCLGLVGDKRGKVYFWDHEYEGDTDLTCLADDFDSFLMSFREL